MPLTIGRIYIDGTGSLLANSIRTNWWSTDLQPPKWNGAKYEGIIADLINDLRGKTAGELIFDEISATNRRLMIAPEPTRGPRYGLGPFTVADQHAAACTAGTPAAGTSAVIFFTPANVVWQGGGSHKAEVLCHEMVHALRAMRGEEIAKPLTQHPFASRYDNLKEFVAITVTNIYSSQRGCYLRRSHDWSKNNPPLSHNEVVSFYKDHKSLFNMVASCPGFLRSLKRINASFNPFREMFAD